MAKPLKKENMKVYIRDSNHVDAIRIELRIFDLPDDHVCDVDEVYKEHVDKLVSEGLIELR